MSKSVRSAARHTPDPTIYPEEERVGEDMLQRCIIELLRPLLKRWLTARKVKAFVGADQFIYWRQHDAHARVAPDLYVLPGVDPDERVRTWKIWLDRVVPSFALEVVSTDWQKDYAEVLDRYEKLGVAEVMVVDPDWKERADGRCWQVFRRVGKGDKRRLVCVEATRDDRVRSKALGCWFRVVGESRDLRVRIGVGERGEELVPTVEELVEAERAAKERALATAEEERAVKEAERSAKEAALARVHELEAELSRRGRSRSGNTTR